MRPNAKVILGLVSGLIGMASVAQADSGYYRFWRGWKTPTLQGPGLTQAESPTFSSVFSYDQFASALNQVFIPATVHYGHGKGLKAYLPGLPMAPALAEAYRQLGFDLPDETALVVYSSKSEYDVLRATPEGKAYADLHKVYFEMDGANPHSRSLTPVPFAYDVQMESAYEVLPVYNPIAWMRAARADSGLEVRLNINLRNPRYSTDEHYLSMLRQYLVQSRINGPFFGLHASIVLVSGNYWIEYQIWNEGMFEHSYKAIQTVVVDNGGMYSEMISDGTFSARAKSVVANGVDGALGFGELVSVQF